MQTGDIAHGDQSEKSDSMTQAVTPRPSAETARHRSSSTGRRGSARAAGRTAASVVRSVLLNLAAIAGGICIVLVILAFAFHITLIMFRTGSMSPSIPTGSVAVVHRIPASEAKVGQIVTVDRQGELPVTHRIVTTTPGPNGTTTLTLKGDANSAPDPVSYQVTTVRKVLASAPGLAYFIVWLDSPLVIGGLTLAVAALVTWVLWPRQRRSQTSGSSAP